MRFSKKPSPAMIVAVCALSFALVGTAIAGTDGVSSKITKSKVKKIAKQQGKKQGKKQANKQLKANVAGSHVNLADNATNATNAQNAANATTAGSVGGVRLIDINYHSDATAQATTVLSAAGLVITATCPAGNLDVTATTTSPSSYLASGGFDVTAGGVTNEAEQEPFDPGDNVDLVPDFNNGIAMHTAFYTATQNVQVNWTADDNVGTGNDFDCDMAGSATVG